MSDSLKTLIILSNYSHDIATAFLFISATGLYLLSRTYQHLDSHQETKAFLTLFRRFSTVAKYSLAWVLIAGVPRVVFYKQLEWSDSAGSLQIVAIVIKHIFMFLLVGIGVVHWKKLSKKAKELKNIQDI